MENLTDKTFKHYVSGNQYVLVEFGTDGSGLCYIVDIILEKMSKTCKNVAFYRMDFERNKKTSDFFSIHITPTILFFGKGELKDRVEGIISETEIALRIHKMLSISTNSSYMTEIKNL